MEKYFEVLKKTHLFQGFSDEEMVPMLDCLSARLTHFENSEKVWLQDDLIKDVGIVVSGKLRIQKEEMSGMVSIISDLSVGDLVAEESFFAGMERMPFSVWAVNSTELIFLNCEEIFKFCSLACKFHSKLVCNIAEMMARKLMLANQKLDILQKSTTREKLLAFFNLYSESSKSTSFTIPFDRRELAEYLCVNRSALSKELCKMRDEGIIEFNRNFFRMLAREI